MATRDNFSNQIVVEALEETLTENNPVTKGNIIDTAGYTKGIRFALLIFEYLDGTHVLSFEDSDDPAMVDAVAVGSEKIIGDTIIVNSATVTTDPWPGNGLFSVKRYVRLVITSTVEEFGVFLEAVAVLSGEYNPQDQ